MIETRITKLFGIKYPILCGGMFWVGRAELIAAVANAGGLGFLTAATYPTIEELKADIRKAKDLTDKPDRPEHQPVRFSAAAADRGVGAGDD